MSGESSDQPPPAAEALGSVGLLRDAVLARGRVEGALLKVDDFLNHRVDPRIMAQIGLALASRLPEPDLILTAEASGIPPAMATAAVRRIPFVYAKKFLGPGDRRAFGREVVSTTRGIEYRVEVGRRVLGAGLRVLVVDDFLSGGRTAEALGQIVEEAASEVVGFGFVIEKSFAGGRSRLESHGWQVDSLIKVASLAGGVIELADEPS